LFLIDVKKIHTTSKKQETMMSKVDAKILAIIVLIILIIIVALYLYHAIQIKNTERQGGKVVVYDSYVVTVKRNHAGKKVFYLNDVETPTLKLKRNVYYEFRNDSRYPIYFTTHSKGGHGAPGSLAKQVPKDFIGMANGTIFFMVTPDIPDGFYYQCGSKRDMGGRVEVV
jgi:uncharacterized protein YxeA